MKPLLTALLVSLMSGPVTCLGQPVPGRRTSPPAVPRVYQLDTMAWPEIDRLDRQRTLFILPVGMIEQHGPHLPVGTDTLGVTHEARGASLRVSRALPGWNVVTMPPINYGHSGANVLGGQPVHPGTYAVRQATVRSLVADLGAEVARNGFKWIFVVNGHGAPTHNIALNEACDFVSETFGVTMLHLTALFRADDAIQARGRQMQARFFSAAQIASFGMDVHAGVGETSGMLALHPDLVRPGHRQLPSQAGASFEALRAIATTPGWRGYLSSPASATAAYGQAVEAWWIEGFADLIVRAVRGEDMSAHPRQPESLPPPVAAMLEKALAGEKAFDAALATWLARRHTR